MLTIGAIGYEYSLAVSLHNILRETLKIHDGIMMFRVIDNSRGPS